MPYGLQIKVIYPMQGRRMVLRTEFDWDRDIEPTRTSDLFAEFELETPAEMFQFKPILVTAEGVRWSMGQNYTAYPVVEDRRDLYPAFHGNPYLGEFSEVFHVPTPLGTYAVRVYTPPGYGDNPIKRYPVIYMHDGSNLFFPEEAFLGREWGVDETMNQLNNLAAVDKVIVVGIYAKNRLEDYTKPGYEAFGRAMVHEIKNAVDRNWRTLPGAKHTAVMGSSLGGLVSFYLAWQYPEVFGKAVCMSSTFSYQNDLMRRVMTEPKRDVTFYLDSGHPADNYEPTQRMRDLMMLRGYEQGRDLLYFNFPGDLHNERYWAARILLPFQFMFGKRPKAAVQEQSD